MAMFFHIMIFNSVYRLPKKTVKIEKEPLLGVEGDLWTVKRVAAYFYTRIWNNVVNLFNLMD